MRDLRALSVQPPAILGVFPNALNDVFAGAAGALRFEPAAFATGCLPLGFALGGIVMYRLDADGVIEVGKISEGKHWDASGRVPGLSIAGMTVSDGGKLYR